MTEIPEELFQIISSDGRRSIVVAGRQDRNVGLFACTCRSGGTAVTIAPTEARDLAIELLRLANEAENDGPSFSSSI